MCITHKRDQNHLRDNQSKAQLEPTSFSMLRFADLVVIAIAGWPHPFPFRTRP
jgi:hypothetical protein